MRKDHRIRVFKQYQFVQVIFSRFLSLIFGILSAVPNDGHAALITQYGVNNSTAANSVAPGLTASTLSASSYSPTYNTDSFEGSHSYEIETNETNINTPPEPMNTGDGYLEFTLTPDSGLGLQLDSVTWRHRAIGFGSTSDARSAIFWSLDGYATRVGLLSFNDINGNSAWLLGTSSFSPTLIYGPVTFRMQVGDNVGPGGDFHRIDDIQINGSLVPEPSSFALAALGLLGLGIVVWRRRRR